MLSTHVIVETSSRFITHKKVEFDKMYRTRTAQCTGVT